MKTRSFFTERPLVGIALALGCGIAAGYYAGFLLWALLAGLGLSILLIVICGCTKHTVIPGFMLLAFFLGMLLCGRQVNQPLPAEGKYIVTGVVDGEVRADSTGKNKTYLRDTVLFDEETGMSFEAGKVYLTLTPEENGFMLRSSQEIRLNGTVYHPSSRDNPYGFDFRLFLLTKGVHTGVSSYEQPEILNEHVFSVSGLLYDLRAAMAERCRLVFGEESALPAALLLGNRTDLPEETQAAFTNAGIAHLLAVSGLHVSLLAAALMLLLKPFHLPPWARLTAVSVFLLLYCAVVGFSASVVRASILTFIMLLSVVARRRTDPLTALSAAFIGILLIRPLDLFTNGFILSFSAVLGIILFGDLLTVLRPQRSRILGKVWDIWKTTLAAQFGVTIPVICCYHSISLIGFLINPLACAVMGILLPVYAVIYIIGWIWAGAGVFLGNIIGYVTGGFTWAVDKLSSLPFATVRTATPSVLIILLIAAGLFLLTRYAVFNKKIRFPLAAACLAGALVLCFTTGDSLLRYVQLSMGQADSAIIIDGDKTVVIDTGEDGGDVCNFLLANDRDADCLIITHLHADHAGGVMKLIQNDIRIGTVYLPAEAETHTGNREMLDLLQIIRERGIPVCYLSRGDTVSTDRVTCSVLWPEAGKQQPAEDANSYSMTMLIDMDGVKLLHMGDVGQAYELYSACGADILKVAHHGSRTATTDAFLDIVAPSCAIITSSRTSSSLPHSETLQRLDGKGIKVYRTDETAALTVCCEDGAYTITAYRGIP
ncbi:MAG: DNA internalization-related competence protein ComEC/Rec2 [Clostridiales bacterium]|nr:DNA internalization-related competence protein ComEC/Rec2 [Clostridiales bacterium]